MNIKVKPMTLKQFKGVVDNSIILAKKLIMIHHGHILPSELAERIQIYLNDNGIQAGTSEIKELISDEIDKDIKEYENTLMDIMREIAKEVK